MEVADWPEVIVGFIYRLLHRCFEAGHTPTILSWMRQVNLAKDGKFHYGREALNADTHTHTPDMRQVHPLESMDVDASEKHDFRELD